MIKWEKHKELGSHNSATNIYQYSIWKYDKFKIVKLTLTEEAKKYSGYNHFLEEEKRHNFRVFMKLPLYNEKYECIFVSNNIKEAKQKAEEIVNILNK